MQLFSNHFFELFLLLLHDVYVGRCLLDAIFIFVDVFDADLVVELFDEVGPQLRRPLGQGRGVLSSDVEFLSVVVQDVDFGRDHPDPGALWRRQPARQPFLQLAILFLFKVLKVLRFGKHRLEILLLLRVHVFDKAWVHILADEVHAIRLALQRSQILKYFLSAFLEVADVLLGNRTLLWHLPLLSMLVKFWLLWRRWLLERLRLGHQQQRVGLLGRGLHLA